ncbi:MAG TPA: OmpA family protein [Candidatus Deferrimicrobium sp.]|nr:OmpA family protein [Candidatus Deferrimicrobium sp.]
MRLVGILLGMAVLLAAGCGVNQTYVQQQIAQSEARTDSKVSAVKDQTDANAAEIARLQSLAQQLSDKTDLAINQAKGFEKYQVLWEGVINFDFDSYEITDVAAATLNEGGQEMEKHPESLLEIDGHTDQRGSSKYNLLLGEKRADAAKRFLVDHFGISLYRLFIISHGEEKPIALPDERNAGARNRRVILKVWGLPT